MHATARMNGHRKRQQMVQLRCEAPLGCCAGRINDHGLVIVFYKSISRGTYSVHLYNFFKKFLIFCKNPEKNPTVGSWVGCLLFNKDGHPGPSEKKCGDSSLPPARETHFFTSNSNPIVLWRASEAPRSEADYYSRRFFFRFLPRLVAPRRHLGSRCSLGLVRP